MTDNTVSAPVCADITRGSAFYRLVWKWHFLASLYVLPFIFILAITGGIYLFQPQIEEIIYRDRLNVVVTGAAQSLELQESAVRAAFPEAKIKDITTEGIAGRATVFTIQSADRAKSYVWVNPYTSAILASQTRDSTMMRMLKKFHGELLLGKIGTKFVELSAHWAIVMLITGIYMWWPRGQRSWGMAFKIPSAKGRAWWRETHMFTGFLAFILILPLLLSGLPWTDIWGGGYKYVQTQAGQTSPSLRPGKDHTQSGQASGDSLAYQDVIDIAVAQGMALPIVLLPPKDEMAVFYLQSGSNKRLDRSEIIVDQYSGVVLNRVDIAQFPFMAKLASYGIGFHQGQLYGTLNIIQNLVAAILGVVLAVSGFVAWWKRRPVGKLGVPATPDAMLGWGMIVLVVVLAILLPLMGASLVLALILDWVIFKRLGWFQGAKLVE
ncbi:MAG: PepSY domain-containing protein [Paracoccaceae bacterium]